MKLVGRVDCLTRQAIMGWVADRDGEQTALPVVVLVNGREVARFTPDRPRAGRPGAVQPNLVRYGFEHEFAPPLSLFHAHEVEVRFAASGDLLNGGGRTFRAMHAQVAPSRARLAPILLTAIGRSGTTYLMSRLREHPGIVVAPAYPFETKLLAYYSAAFRTLVSSADRKNSTEPRGMTLPSQRFYIGHNPFNAPNLFNACRKPDELATFFEETVPAAIAGTFRELLLGYYAIVERDQGKSEARYFAEKCGLDEVSRSGPELFFPDVREIVLVRDPRDVLCSWRSFWTTWNNDTNAAIAALRAQFGTLDQIRKQRSGQRVVVRYEDLVQRPAEALGCIWNYLELDHPLVRDPDADGTMFERHATSRNAAASIGRWRTDLAEEEIAAANRAFRPLLEAFGYEDALGTAG